MLETKDVCLAYDGAVVVDRLDLRLRQGEITAIVGPNGSGKSTVLKSLARILRPASGTVYLQGKDLAAWAPREAAKEIAHLPQLPEAPAGLLVRDLVGYGRHPWVRGFSGFGKSDRDAVQRALELTGMSELSERPVGSLSGGQRQRAWIAMALAQDASCLLLDEPTSALDIAHQMELMDLIQALNVDAARTFVLVLHDLNQAARVAHRMIAMKAGAIEADGPPATVMTPEILRAVFGIEADVIADPRTGAPLFLPWSSRQNEIPGASG
ncbi:MAG: ABC transporter ATP-binding protein [Roseibium sp.]